MPVCMCVYIHVYIDIEREIQIHTCTLIHSHMYPCALKLYFKLQCRPISNADINRPFESENKRIVKKNDCK